MGQTSNRRDKRSKYQRLVEEIAEDRLGYPLRQWLADQLEQGLSPETAADVLVEEADLDVPARTLRRWYLEKKEEAA